MNKTRKEHRFWAYTNNISLKYKLIIVVSLLFIAFASVVNYMTFNNASNALLEETLNLMIANMTQINNSINSNAEYHAVALNAFCSASNLSHTLTTRRVENEQQYIADLKESILIFKDTNPHVIDLKIFAYNQSLPMDDYSLFGIESFKVDSLLEEILSVNKGLDENDPKIYSSTIWSSVGDGTWNKFGYIPAVYCYKVLYEDTVQTPIAILRMDVTADSLFSGLKAERVNQGLPGEFFVANANGNVIYSSAIQRLGLYQYKSRIEELIKLGDDQGYFIYESPRSESEYICYQKNNMDWYTIYRVPKETLFANITDIRNSSMLITLTFLVITLAAAVLLIHISTRRLLGLAADIGRFSKSNTRIQLRVTGKDEVGKVAGSVRDMLYEIDTLLLETHQQKEREKELLNENHYKELLRREAEFKALQMQINPHFLYNTLEMIKGLVYSDNPEKNIITATQALSDMFRYNITGSYHATIRDELAHIDDYLIIQNFRFDKVIHLHNNIPDILLDTPIVRFTMEPIIENSIKHGFWSLTQENNIYISHTIKDNKLLIHIHDDGSGIEPSVLTALQQKLKHGTPMQDDNKQQRGIGLLNVHLRLNEFFGDGYGLTIQSENGFGSTLTITIPLDKKAEEDQNV